MHAFHLQKELKEERWHNELYLFIDAQIGKYQELIENKSDFNIFNSEYLEPIILTIMQSYKNEPIFEEIIFLAKNARVKMNDIKTDVENMIEEMDKVKIELEKSLKKVEETIQKLYNVL